MNNDYLVVEKLDHGPGLGSSHFIPLRTMAGVYDNEAAQLRRALCSRTGNHPYMQAIDALDTLRNVRFGHEGLLVTERNPQIAKPSKYRLPTRIDGSF
jgi:hypothetical protein